MAILGMFAQEGPIGSAWGDWAQFTASLLRAFEYELGDDSDSPDISDTNSHGGGDYHHVNSGGNNRVCTVERMLRKGTGEQPQ
eukprot:12939202-Prorocentrum_lima.AAC.1